LKDKTITVVLKTFKAVSVLHSRNRYVDTILNILCFTMVSSNSYITYFSLYIKLFQLKGRFINWTYYKLLYEEDSKDQGKFRIVPKLTNNHIQPSNTKKMRVSFATQV